MSSRRNSRSTGWRWAVVPVLLAGVLIAPAHVPAVSASDVTTQTPSHPLTVIESVSVTLGDSEAKLTAAIADASTRTSDVVANGVVTDELAGLKAAVDEALAGAEETLPYAVVTGLVGDSREPVEAAARSQEIRTSTDQRIERLTGAVVAWETSLAAETERVRLAAEAEAAAAAAASTYVEANSADSAPDTGVTTASSGSGEDDYSRMARIAATLPWSFSWVLGGCTSANDGCYNFDHVIHIETSTLNRADCYARGVLAHEFRHMMQHDEGLVQFDGNGGLVNRDWLESDAYAFEGSYGC